MKYFFLLTLSMFLFRCGTNQQKPLSATPVKATSGKMILLGPINVSNLRTSPITPWFNQEYDRINTDPNWIKEIKPFLKGLKIKVFMGTWCEDSKRELPHFIKLLNALEFDQNHLKMYAMSEEKTTPRNFEKDLDIYNIPTIIFFKDGNEMNRFVEFPLNSLESDIEKIVKGAAYSHSYR
tara:strand:- start:2082 stop:2621 length:540 start_codon:yes stop_codon:yes gene_type:complete